MTAPETLISRPGGGGSLKSLGEAFAPDLFTGTGNLRVPLALPRGRNGFGPDLALSYSTGQGSSPFGLGWALPVPRIARKTSKGIPRYDDATDVFVLTGEDDLVPVGGDLHATRYRPRTEGSFAQVTHVHDPSVGDYWDVHARDGSRDRYGTARPVGADDAWRDPAVLEDPERPGRRWAWHLTESQDAAGNIIRYTWEGQYLRQVDYIDYGAADALRFLVSVKLVYAARPDPFTDRRPGFAIETGQRCTRIEVWIADGEPELVQTCELLYADEAAASPQKRLSLLAELRVTGVGATGDTQALPALRLAYGDFEPDRRRLMQVTGEIPPAALVDGRRELVDLTCSGLPDLVEIDGEVRYWRNLGGGRFDRARTMRRAPANARLGDRGVQLVDADGDGCIDLMVSGGRMNGYYSLSPDGEWDARSFHQCLFAPSFAFDDPEVRLVDLDGDGVTDALRSGSELECYFHDPLRGWRETRRVPRADIDVSFADPHVKWGDLTGDGLTDLVLVHDGRVDYWPARGFGDFDARVTMRGAPRFGADFDPARVLIGDVDGDGLADLVFVADGRVVLCMNQAGRAWSEPIEIRGMPALANNDVVRLVDLLGTGIAGLLYSRASDGSMYFFDFTDGHKPFLLESIDNSAGAVTRIEYRSSSEMALASREAGTPWRTPLPFPVQVVASVTQIERIAGTKRETVYAYRHGYWDGIEREFRGFARVDQRDTIPGGAETRTWFHLGAVPVAGGVDAALDCANEYWAGDVDGPKPPVQGIEPATGRDALRALRGRRLRSETYGLDDPVRPYTVSAWAYDVVTVVPASRPTPAVLFPMETMQRSTEWERGTDPRTRLSFTGDFDSYGQPRVELALAVPRGRDHRVRASAGAAPYLATFNRTGYALPDDPSRVLFDRVAHRTTYELLGDAGATAWDVWKSVLDGSAQSRAIAQTLSYYDGDAFTGLPLGHVGNGGALVRSETLVAAGAEFADAYGSVPPPLQAAPAWTDEYPADFRAALAPLAGYRVIAADAIRVGGYYSSTDRREVSARGLLLARRDALGSTTTAAYDAYELLPTRAVDPNGLVTTATYDYRVQEPTEVEDANGNRTAYTYTPLGLLASIAVLGSKTSPAGDAGHAPSTTYTYELKAFSERGQPNFAHTKRLTGYGGTDAVEHRVLFDGLGRVLQTRTLAEDVQFGDATFGGGVLSADPGVSAMPTARPRAPGDPDNVVVSGWEVRDAKGRVVRRYEPFFSTGWDYAAPAEQQRGQSIALEYDARDRVVRTVAPDGSEQRTVFGAPGDVTLPSRYAPSPWVRFSYDANDNAGRTPDADPAADPSHWNTPASSLFDALCREVESVERTGTDAGAQLTVRREFDIRGNVVAVVDALGRKCAVHRYDLVGRRLYTKAIDSGTTTILFDAAGDEVERRTDSGALILQSRDKGRRVTRLWARDRSGESVTLRERIVFGDAAEAGFASPADAAARNLLGREYRHFDEAGLVETAYDFRGNVSEKSRRTIRDDVLLAPFAAAGADRTVTPLRIDWQPPAGTSLEAHAESLLEATTYQTTQELDALDRPVVTTLPVDAEGKRRRLQHTYDRGGALERVLLDEAVIVHRVAYDAKGQRTLAAYGDPAAAAGTRVLARFAYDPRTFNLVRLRAEPWAPSGAFDFAGAGPPLQDATYAYDLVGNPRRIQDRTLGAGPQRQPDLLERTFSYDPLYRLTSASGREARTPPANPWDAAPRGADPGNTQLYVERYAYDAVGNLSRLDHRVDGAPGATSVRKFELVAGLNRLAALDIGATSIDYDYDAAGNLVRETTSRWYEWDHSSRQRAFRVQAGAQEPSQYAQYLYDSAGRRVKRILRRQGGAFEVAISIDGVFEHFREVKGASVVENDVLQVNDGVQRVATVRVGVPFADDGTPARTLEVADSLGSVIVTVGEAGWISREEYSPYGDTTFGGYARKRYRFAGRVRDGESGLYAMGARYYAPWLGRWLSPDPAGGIDGTNLYVYARGSPLRFRDGSGLAAQPADGPNARSPDAPRRIEVPSLADLAPSKPPGLMPPTSTSPEKQLPAYQVDPPSLPQHDPADVNGMGEYRPGRIPSVPLPGSQAIEDAIPKLPPGLRGPAEKIDRALTPHLPSASDVLSGLREAGAKIAGFFRSIGTFFCDLFRSIGTFFRNLFMPELLVVDVAKEVGKILARKLHHAATAFHHAAAAIHHAAAAIYHAAAAIHHVVTKVHRWLGGGPATRQRPTVHPAVRPAHSSPHTVRQPASQPARYNLLPTPDSVLHMDGPTSGGSIRA